MFIRQHVLTTTANMSGFKCRYVKVRGQHKSSGKHYTATLLCCMFYMVYAYHLFYISKLFPTITEEIFLYALVFHVEARQRLTHACLRRRALNVGGLNLWLLITVCCGIVSEGEKKIGKEFKLKLNHQRIRKQYRRQLL